eukprot:Rhum_TRINITY_DN8627_c0_g1::Rhum_TRINITY_DN8627_c0_g1_i1::g.29096::m.29096
MLSMMRRAAVTSCQTASAAVACGGRRYAGKAKKSEKFEGFSPLGSGKDSFEARLQQKKERDLIVAGAREHGGETRTRTSMLPSEDAGDVRAMPPILGAVEHILLDPTPTSYGQSNQGEARNIWRHVYTVNGIAATKYETREWYSARPAPGISVGTPVRMTCFVDVDDNVIIRDIIKASPEGLEQLNQQGTEKVQRKSREMTLRSRVALSVLNSPLTVNLDHEGYFPVVRDVYCFVKDLPIDHISKSG